MARRADNPATTKSRIEYGDFQTPLALAEAALALLPGLRPRTILEPTCGEGAFLRAAAVRFPVAELRGYELNPDYARRARRALPRARSLVTTADFFSVDWDREVAGLREPILVVGNPPWVTSATLGMRRSTNRPARTNPKALSGLDALTGKSNFDVSEWMLLRLIEALREKDATFSVLCKYAVARRVAAFAWKHQWPIEPVSIRRIDAASEFGVAVDAVLFTGRLGRRFDRRATWPVHAALDAPAPTSRIAVVGGKAIPDERRHRRTRRFEGTCVPEWRSGVKHDCTRVMELVRDAEKWENGFGDVVEIEDAVLFPLLKSSDVANGRLDAGRALVLPQRTLGDDTRGLRTRAPKAFAYLHRHRALLDGRRSAIYRDRPPFSVFGVGIYSFSPWKIGISGLYKRLAFALVGPRDGRPVVFDDTCYFLPFDDERAARRAFAALTSRLATDFFEARLFWDDKRPINKELLQSLDLERVIATGRVASAAAERPHSRTIAVSAR